MMKNYEFNMIIVGTLGMFVTSLITIALAIVGLFYVELYDYVIKFLFMLVMFFVIMGLPSMKLYYIKKVLYKKMERYEKKLEEVKGW